MWEVVRYVEDVGGGEVRRGCGMVVRYVEDVGWW